MTNKQYDTILQFLSQLGEQVVLLRHDMNRGFEEVRGELRAELTAGLRQLRTELQAEFATGIEALRADLRVEFSRAIDELRTELKTDFSQDISELCTELRAEFTLGISDLRTELVNGLARQEAISKDILETVTRHFEFLESDGRNKDAIYRRRFLRLEKHTGLA